MNHFAKFPRKSKRSPSSARHESRLCLWKKTWSNAGHSSCLPSLFECLLEWSNARSSMVPPLMPQNCSRRQIVATRLRSRSVSAPVAVTARLRGRFLRRPSLITGVCWYAVATECSSSGVFGQRNITGGWCVIAISICGRRDSANARDKTFRIQ